MLLSMLIACTHPAVDSASPQSHDTVDRSGVVTCDSPGLRASEGPLYRPALPTDAREVESSPSGCGGSLADLDGDGWMDILWVCRGDVALLMGEASGFVEATSASGLEPLEYAVASSVVDIEDDGDLDILLLSRVEPDVLYRNDGAGVFTLDPDSGLTTEALASTGAVWMDGDRDGDLDLFISGHDNIAWTPKEPTTAKASQLYENDGGVLIDRSDRIPQDAHDGHTFLATWMDLTGDQRPDLYLVNDHGWLNQPNHLLVSTGELQFELDHSNHGLEMDIAGMGLGVGDLNGDLWPDFMLPQWGLSLVESDGAGGWYFTNVLRELSVDMNLAAWGTELADMDNDGDLDAVVVLGLLDLTGERDNPDKQPDILLQWDDGVFTDVAADWGFNDPGQSRGLALGDVNRDGFLDVLVGMLDGVPRLHLSRCDDSAWLTVRLQQPAPNRNAIGATVEAITDDGHQIRWMMAGGTGLFSSNPAEVHFGLGGADAADLRVTWPDGTVESWPSISARQHVLLTRE